MGANLVVSNSVYERDNGAARIRIIDYIAHGIIKILILPFLGNCFVYIVTKYFFQINNKPLIWASYIHWIFPTSIDLISIAQSMNVNVRFISWCCLLQFISLSLLNNLVNVPLFLNGLNLLNSHSND